MMKFRIFCELLAKTMLESIDFTDVSEGYRRNEKPEILGIATEFLDSYFLNSLCCRNEKPEILGIATISRSYSIETFLDVEMKSPRDRALQLYPVILSFIHREVEMKNPSR